MKIGFVGLGKMGGNMVERLLGDGHDIVAFDLSRDAMNRVKELGASTSDSIEDLVAKLSTEKKVVWVMVPAGDITDNTIAELASILNPGDIIIDGGNTNYKDTIARASFLSEKEIDLLDAGTSGGVWGLQIGYCQMIGGSKDAFDFVEPIFKTLAPPDGYKHVGPPGAGHFVKMVHNGIEYGMMAAYAEGFEILENKKEFDLNLEGIAQLWNQGSVIRSWLLELAGDAFKKDPGLRKITGYSADSGEGRWTVKEAIDLSTPAPVITLALMQRFRSRQDESFGDKVIAALRDQFGGHGVREK